MNFLAAAAYQESRFAEFTNIRRCGPTVTDLLALTDGYPVQACDNGYGIMQLTQGVPGGLTYNLGNYTDTPTQDMIWNWVANINAGENVMLDKLKDETTYEDRFTQDTGFYYPTPEQTEMNVWQRYNGGLYWMWNGGQWTKNTAWCLNKTYQNYTCNGEFPSGGQCYADCVKYWSNNPLIATPNNPQWCQ